MLLLLSTVTTRVPVNNTTLLTKKLPPKSYDSFCRKKKQHILQIRAKNHLSTSITTPLQKLPGIALQTATFNCQHRSTCTDLFNNIINDNGNVMSLVFKRESHVFRFRLQNRLRRWRLDGFSRFFQGINERFIQISFRKLQLAVHNLGRLWGEKRNKKNFVLEKKKN